MLKEKKTYKDDMLVGDLVENREFDVNCNFEIYDCTEKGSDWQREEDFFYNKRRLGHPE